VAEIAVAVVVAGQQHQPRAVVEVHLHAHDRLYTRFLRLLVEGDHAKHVVAVGEGKRWHLERFGRAHQLFYPGRAFAQRVRGMAVKMHKAHATIYIS
jgi:hypothetical protein